MAKTNLTVQLDEAIVRRAKVVAAKRGSSVSALVARSLEAMVQDDQRYEEAWAQARTLRESEIDRGSPVWSRDDLHQR